MARVTEITNTSGKDLDVQLTGGAKVTLPPNASLKDADIDNIDNLRGQAKVIENLTEVGTPQGKTLLHG